MKLEMWEGSMWIKKGKMDRPARWKLAVSGAPSQGGPASCPVSHRAEPHEACQQEGILAGQLLRHPVCEDASFHPGGRPAGLGSLWFVPSPLDVFQGHCFQFSS